MQDFGLPVTEVQAPIPPPSPVAYWNVDSTSVTLGLPGLGAVKVSGHGITVLAPDAHARNDVWTRLRHWATGQYFAAQGFRVLPGCVVARHGLSVAITGPPRRGATALGLQMTRRGWGLVSDGVVVIDSAGTCRALHPTATLDAQPAELLFGDYPQEPASSGRDRRIVSAPSHGDARLAAIATIEVKDAAESLSIYQFEGSLGPREEWTTGILCSVPGTEAPAGVPAVPTIVLRRSIPRTVDELSQVAPPALAEKLDELLRTLGL